MLSLFLVAQLSVNASSAGGGVITHYWDCCKASCSWDSGQGTDRIAYSSMCGVDGSKLDPSAVETGSACDAGGSSGVVMCPDQTPFYDKASGAWMGFVETI